MEKLNIKDLNLLVTAREIKLPEIDWLHEAIELLIKQRVQHCRTELENAMLKDEAFFQNSFESPIIVYKNKSGKFYGHFSVPTYNSMIEFLNHTDSISCYINRGIVQQALRQYFYILSNIKKFEGFCFNLAKYNKNYEDLEGALTELMLVLPN